MGDGEKERRYQRGHAARCVLSRTTPLQLWPLSAAEHGMGRYGILQFVSSLHQYEQFMLYALFGPGHQADPQQKNDRSTPNRRGLFTIMTSDDPRPPPSIAAGVSTEIVAPGVSTEIVLQF